VREDHGILLLLKGEDFLLKRTHAKSYGGTGLPTSAGMVPVLRRRAPTGRKNRALPEGVQALS
jgi:hypothetical protein